MPFIYNSKNQIMANMWTDVTIFVFSCHIGLVTALDYCSKYNYFGYIYYTYCSGYCSGLYGYQYCFYYYYTPDSIISYGAIAGIVVGSIVFLAIVISICVGICACCTKSAGTRGRVVHPSNTQGGIAVVHATANISDNRLYNTPMPPPYPYYTPTYGAPHTQPSTFMPPPPPSYSSMDYDRPPPPPTYAPPPDHRNDPNNIPPSAPPDTTLSSRIGVRLPPIERNNT